MLVLKRTREAKIVIGGNIVITLLDAGNGWAKIGIEAPKEIPVVRPDARNKQPKGKVA